VDETGEREYNLDTTTKTMTRIIFDNWNLGGISDSKYSGIPKSSYKVVGLNLHEEPGVLKCNQATANDRASGSTIASNVISIVHAANNLTYFFSDDSPTIYTRNSSSVYATLGDVTGGSTIQDAKLFNGYIYWTIPTKVGRHTPGGAWSNPTFIDEFKVLNNNTTFHPMLVLENDLYVGDKNILGKITPTDTATGTITTALTLDSRYTIETLWRQDTSLLIAVRQVGSTPTSFAGFSRIVKWDLISKNIESEVEVPEFGITAFMDFGGGIIFQAGNKGMWYSYNGKSVAPFKRLPGDWSGTNAARVYQNSITTHNGLPIFGVSQETGSPLEYGMYKWGGYDGKYPSVLSADFFASDEFQTNTIIKAAATVGTDLLFFTNRSSGTMLRVNKIDTTKKISENTPALLETLVINTNRDIWKTIKITICYRSLPTGSSIVVGKKVNHATNYTTVTTKQWDNNKTIVSEVGINNANTIQFRLQFYRGTDTNTAPEIEQIIIDFPDAK